MSVEIVIMHPEFNIESRAHDLALIRLSRPTKFEKRIAPICLPNPGLSTCILMITNLRSKCN